MIGNTKDEISNPFDIRMKTEPRAVIFLIGLIQLQSATWWETLLNDVLWQRSGPVNPESSRCLGNVWLLLRPAHHHTQLGPLHFTSPPTSQPLPAYATALDEQLLQLGMGRTHSLLWQGKRALAMWPGFFFIQVQCSSVWAKTYAVTHLTWQRNEAGATAKCCSVEPVTVDGRTALLLHNGHRGIENYFKNEIAVKPQIATTLPDFTPNICKYYSYWALSSSVISSIWFCLCSTIMVWSNTESWLKRAIITISCDSLALLANFT